MSKLNVGDVSGPRWVGGTTNPPSREGSMNDYQASIGEARRAQVAVYLAAPGPVAADLSRIIKGLADAVEALQAERDAEMAAALKALTESRARYGDLEARAAELEAVIAKAEEVALEADQGDSFLPITEALESAPTVALADRDREVSARAIDGFADLQERTTKLHAYAMDDVDWHEHGRLMASLRNYSAAIRRGVV